MQGDDSLSLLFSISGSFQMRPTAAKEFMRTANVGFATMQGERDSVVLHTVASLQIKVRRALTATPVRNIVYRREDAVSGILDVGGARVRTHAWSAAR